MGGARGSNLRVSVSRFTNTCIRVSLILCIIVYVRHAGRRSSRPAGDREGRHVHYFKEDFKLWRRRLEPRLRRVFMARESTLRLDERSITSACRIIVWDA